MYSPPIARLIEEFEKMPGVGRKSAVRMAFYIMSLSEGQAKNFADAILDMKKSIHLCELCQDFTDSARCPICSNPKRDSSVICVVETPKDVTAMEKTREFNGLYHVLHGVMSPIDGLGPDDIKIKELTERVVKYNVQEVIMALSPRAEGDTTALYIAKLLAPFNVRVTRIARGIPIGGDLDYVDEVTLAKALEGRQNIL